jgi:CheY-like chemotaxis protein
MGGVLLIDHDRGLMDEISQALDEHGVATWSTEDGSKGLGLAKKHKPEVIVLCVELNQKINRISGFSICNKLKKDSELAKIPLILTSANMTTETLEQHKKLKTRAQKYLTKPYAIDDLLGSLNDFMEIDLSDDMDSILDHLEIELPDMELPGVVTEGLRATVLTEHDQDLASSAATTIMKLPTGGDRYAALREQKERQEAKSKLKSMAQEIADLKSQLEDMRGSMESQGSQEIQLKREVKQARRELEELRSDLTLIRTQRDALQQTHDLMSKQKGKARRALDIAMQLVEETRNSVA